MSWALISTPMLHRLVTFDKNLLSCVVVALGKAMLGPLGFLGIVIERSFHAVDKTVIKVKTHLGQDSFNFFKGNVHHIIADTHESGRNKMRVFYTFKVRQ